MKHIAYAALIFFTAFLNFGATAQSPCSAVTLELIHPVPQNGQYNYWGVRVSISQPYHEDVTVSGTIYQEGQQYVDGWQLTITSGNLSAETSVDYYQTDPATSAEATITSVSPCPSSTDYQFFAVSNVTLLNNISIRNKIIEIFFSPTDNLNPYVQYDLNNMELVTFNNTDIQGVLIKEISFTPNSINNHIAVIYIKDDAVGDMAIEYEAFEDVNGKKSYVIKDYIGEIIGTVHVYQNGNVTVSANPNWSEPQNTIAYKTKELYYPIIKENNLLDLNYNDYNNFFVGNVQNIVYDFTTLAYQEEEDIYIVPPSWWKRWASCIGTGFQQLTSGGIGESFGLLTCIVAGPYCAAGAGVGCAAHATFYK
ncbi:MAG: hypothetical protein ACR2KB_01060 [Chitinophagaceae bacterium]